MFDLQEFIREMEEKKKKQEPERVGELLVVRQLMAKQHSN